jgi:phenylpropionate dioxygenase-like ring-hydroxylating dioxygenase large terminal subunit
MAIADDYMTLTRVGPRTPMGNLLRRYWIPAVMSEQLTERGGAPVRTRLLGESLVAFRDPRGVLGLIGE